MSDGVREYVRRMRELTTSVFKRNERIRELKDRTPENERLREENEALRAELRRQWGYNHAEHCDNTVWSHPPGEDCDWPLPELLRGDRNSSS